VIFDPRHLRDTFSFDRKNVFELGGITDLLHFCTLSTSCPEVFFSVTPFFNTHCQSARVLF